MALIWRSCCSDKGYTVHGLIRRASTFNTDRIDHLYKDFHDPDARVYLHYGDLCVSGPLTDLLYAVKPERSTTSVPKAMFG